MKKTLQALTISALLGILPLVPQGVEAYTNGPEMAKATVLNITGEAERQVAPDYALLSLGIESHGATAVEAKSKSDAVMSTLISQVKNQGILKSDIQTTNFSISPESYYDNNQRKPAGYSVNNTITIKIRDLALVSRIIDTATQAGASNIHSLSFRSDKADSLDDSLTTEAIRDARHKADVIASALGMTVDGVESIQTSDASTRNPNYDGMMLRAVAMTSTPVETGSLVVHKSVSIAYRLK